MTTRTESDVRVVDAGKAHPAGIDALTGRVLARLCVMIGWAASLAGGLVLFGGWVLHVAALKSVRPGLSTMKPNTAVGIVALGTALALTVAGRKARLLGDAAASIALALGVITLAEYALNWNPGIDQWLFNDAATSPAAV